MEWFRTYNAMVHKPKFVHLSAEAIGYWTMFACVASQWVPRGSLPDDVEELAIIVHRPSGKVAEMLEVLLDAELLERRESGDVWFYKWESFQPPSTERANKSKQTQHSATNGNPRGEESKRRNTPLNPPKGGKKKRPLQPDEYPPMPSPEVINDSLDRDLNPEAYRNGDHN